VWHWDRVVKFLPCLLFSPMAIFYVLNYCRPLVFQNKPKDLEIRGNGCVVIETPRQHITTLC
jgi:hypothetical protein